MCLDRRHFGMSSRQALVNRRCPDQHHRRGLGRNGNAGELPSLADRKSTVGKSMLLPLPIVSDAVGFPALLMSSARKNMHINALQQEKRTWPSHVSNIAALNSFQLQNLAHLVLLIAAVPKKKGWRIGALACHRWRVPQRYFSRSKQEERAIDTDALYRWRRHTWMAAAGRTAQLR